MPILGPKNWTEPDLKTLLDSISQNEINKIRRHGSVLIRDVVDDAKAVQWKNELKEFVKANDAVAVTNSFLL